jgi:choline dehydrogenase-like flavoprotein
MGTDQMAVVAPDLRVRGLDGLRVCDSSAMPRVPSSNTNAPTIMVGEKAADLVRGVAAMAPAALDRPAARATPASGPSWPPAEAAE